VALWNRGNRPIKKQNVLKPVVIYTQDNSPILEATIRKTSRDVTHLSLNLDELQKGRVTIDWDILERNDGGIIQLIYAGKPDVHIQAEGVIEGQPSIDLVEFSGTIKSPYEQYESERSDYRLLESFLLVLGLLLILGASRVPTTKARFIRASESLADSINSYIRSVDKSIQWEHELIEQNDRFIAAAEERKSEAEERGSAELVKLNSDTIVQYRKEQQASRDRIKNLESKREELEAQLNEEGKDRKKEERKFDRGLVVVLLLVLLDLISAFYLIFIAQPIRPPFGF
jgi:cell division protein FtsB